MTGVPSSIVDLVRNTKSFRLLIGMLMLLSLGITDSRAQVPGSQKLSALTWTGEQVDDISGQQIMSFWIADVDRDGQNEILATTYNGSSGLILLYKRENDAWTRHTIDTTSKRPRVLDIGDADSDGSIEVLVDLSVNYVYASNDGELRLYHFKDGTWTYQTILAGSAGSYTGAIGDANGDGKNDIVAGGYNSGQILILENTSGSFVKSQIATTSQADAYPAIGDAMHLGKSQVYTGTHTSGHIYAYQWNGSTWVQSIVEENTGYIAIPLIGDVDNDGKQDLLVSKYGGSWGLKLYQYSGDAWSQTILETEDRGQPNIMDLDGDGKNEVVASSGHAAYAYQYQSGNAWNRSTLIADAGFTIGPQYVGDALNNGHAAIVLGQSDGGKIWLYHAPAQAGTVDGLVHHFALDEVASSATVTDSSGSNAGKNFGATVGVASGRSWLGTAYRFDGVNDYVGVYPLERAENEEYTFSVWARGQRVMLSFKTPEYENYFGYDSRDNQIFYHLGLYDSSSGFSVDTSSRGDLSTGWHLYALRATRNGASSHRVENFLDGVLLGGRDKDTPIPAWSFAEFGRTVVEHNGQFAGELGDIRIWNRALSDAEMASVFTGGAVLSIALSSTSVSTGVVTNTGGETLSVSGITSTNSQFTAIPTSFSLSAGASQTVTVTFTPMKVGWEQSTLTMSHNAAGGTSTVTASGIGRIEPPTGDLAATRIAFYSNRDGNRQIYTMRPDGTDLLRLTDNSQENYSPTWSLDGSKIAFWSDTVGEVYIMDADGSNVVQLTNAPGKDRYPSWSPDGTKLAFNSQRDGNEEIYVVNVDGTNPINLSNNPAPDWVPSWSPDGTKIAFDTERDGNHEIYVMNADGSNPVNLTRSPAHDINRPGWSPDGTKLLFSSDRDGAFHQIYMMSADGNDVTRLTNNSWDAGGGCWSPDGSQIVFVGYLQGTYEIFVMNADGSNQRRLTNNSVHDTDPTWSPFLTQIAMPAPPSGLTATLGNNQVSLSWTANTESNLSSYIIYRSTTANFTPSAGDSIAQVNKPGTSYTNTGLSAGTYYYKIKAVDTAGNKSDESNQASATLAPKFSASSTNLAFGDIETGSTGTKTVTVSNTGNATLTVTGISLTGTDTAQFSVTPTTVSINSGAAAQTITVTFTPTSIGSKSATLSFTHNAAGSPSTVTLTGNAIQAPPANSRKISVGTASGSSGSTVSVPISIDDATRIAGGDFSLIYNANTLTVKEVKGSDLLTSAGITVVSNPATPGQLKMAMAGASGIQSGSGILMTVTFEITSNAAEGKTDLQLQGSPKDENGKLIPIVVVNGSVTVVNAGLLGDVNNDGTVDSGDAILVLRYSAGLSTLPDVQKNLGDVNSDGSTDAGDAILILRYSAGLIAAFPRSGSAKPSPAASHFQDSVQFADITVVPNAGLEIPLVLKSGVNGVDLTLTCDSRDYQQVQVKASQGLLTVIKTDVPGEIRLSAARLDAAEPVSLYLNLKGAQQAFDFQLTGTAFGVDGRQIGTVGRVFNHPTNFSLRVFPNPFNPSTTLYYDLPESEDIFLSIYNTSGQLVRTLVSGRYAAGQHTAVWDGIDAAGRTVASGLYICRLEAGKYYQAQKMLLLK